MTELKNNAKINGRREKLKRIYIDFDNTLFNTGLLKKTIFSAIANEVTKENALKSADDVKLAFETVKHENADLGFCEICLKTMFSFGLKQEAFEKILKDVLSHADEFYYSDSLEFLKEISQKGFEINILTYTRKSDFEFQLSKISRSKIADFADNIIICTKAKGELHLDYEDAIFIDDNPRDLISMFNVGVAPERLFRIKRENAKYSLIKINEFKPKEFSALSEIKF